MKLNISSSTICEYTMLKELPLFPLNLVAFPGESLNLHIFEPRYTQLINDCLQMKTNFGIPTHVHGKLEYGTEVAIDDVAQIYDDGRMDIKTKGIKSFVIVDFENPWNGRLYAGGKVSMIDHIHDQDPDLATEVLENCFALFDWLQMRDEVSHIKNPGIYDLIHKIGLKLEEEYELIKMTSEHARQLYILKHLENLIPALERAEKAKEKIILNGHFKHFDPLKF
ncbi:MAG: Lon protease-like protein [Marinoscillum sp.]|jgi:Lon protease-like protein